MKKPKKFETKEQFLEAFKEFLAHVVENNFEIMPSQLRFCWWYEKKYTSIDPRTIWNTTNRYFPSAKKEMNALISDMLVEGGSKGHYQSAITIFTLKNWCSWQDKPEVNANEEVLAKLDDVLDRIK